MEPNAWPDDVGSWVALIAQSLGIAAVVGGAVWGIFMRQINGLGGRVNNVEASQKGLETDVDNLKRADDRRTFEYNAISERMGRMEGTLREISTTVHSSRDGTAMEEGKIRERLVAIETRMDIFDVLGDALTKIAKERER